MANLPKRFSLKTLLIAVAILAAYFATIPQFFHADEAPIVQASIGWLAGILGARLLRVHSKLAIALGGGVGSAVGVGIPTFLLVFFPQIHDHKLWGGYGFLLNSVAWLFVIGVAFVVGGVCALVLAWISPCWAVPKFYGSAGKQVRFAAVVVPTILVALFAWSSLSKNLVCRVYWPDTSYTLQFSFGWPLSYLDGDVPGPGQLMGDGPSYIWRPTGVESEGSIAQPIPEEQLAALTLTPRAMSRFGQFHLTEFVVNVLVVLSVWPIGWIAVVPTLRAMLGATLEKCP